MDSRVFQAADGAVRLIEAMRALVPELNISSARPESASVASDADEAAWLARDGYAILRPVREQAAVRDLVRTAITRLVEGGLPAVFIYLFDEAWVIGEALRARLSTMLGRPYVLGADGWAWSVPVGTGRGWGPHRDDSRLLDREAPERVNVWLALTDAGADRACIHVVPLDEDPGYPSNDGLDAPLTAVRALPVEAGTALAWNANLLHWGGACSRRALGPRIAISFTMLRADALTRTAFPVLTEEWLSPLGRVDLLAGMIQSYESKGLDDVSAEIMAWAKATCALRARVSALVSA
jgi:hypothetical protein